MDSVFHAAVDTNNGTESQNKVLKYSYMPQKKNTSLSSIAATLVENFLPDSYRTYQMNYMMSDQYRPYKTFVPTYLHNRPKAVILHCLDRKKKSTKYTEEDVDGDHGKFTVKTPSGSVHNVDFGTSTGVPSCTCKDWARSNLPCKHFAAFPSSKKWNWESLPQAYLNGPYTSCWTTTTLTVVLITTSLLQSFQMCQQKMTAVVLVLVPSPPPSTLTILIHQQRTAFHLR